MFETILIALIVAAVLVLAGRSFYKIMTNKKSGLCYRCDSCGCGSAKKEEP